MPDNPAERLLTSLADRYTIGRELGAGGMATVYLAHDIKHDRDVAIKVLHPDLGAALGSERFLTEIRTTARLQHPHILPLLDSGDASGLLYYVMPLVTGETLRARLEREKQLPIDDAVLIAREVADALGYAHSLGVIHRDIKPENILLQNGHALVADFGIALAVQSAGGARMTQTGLSLGTPQYMSPEQAMGERAIDARSDVYALGAVTYEMLTGDPPFTGSTVQAIVARVLTEKPTALRTLRDTVPPDIEYAVLKALAKLPADRFATATAFSTALDMHGGRSQFAYGESLNNSRGAATIGAQTVGTAQSRSSWLRTSLLASAAIIGPLLAVFVWTRLHAPTMEADAVTRFALQFKTGEGLNPSVSQPLALSPDGRTIAYVSDAGGRSLAVRRLDELHAKVIPGTLGATSPFFSPDGKWIGFFNATLRKLYKVPVDGGVIGVIAEADVVTTQGASWAPNNRIVLGSSLQSFGLATVAASGGPLKVLTQVGLVPGDVQHRWPHVLPDGETVLFTSWGANNATARIGVASLSTGKATVLDLHGTFPIGMQQGNLLYLRADGALMAAPFDVKSQKVTGESVALQDGVSLNGVGSGSVALSDNGTLVYATGTTVRRLVFVDEHGGTRSMTDELRAFGNPRFSPNGRKVALDITTPSNDIWVLDVAGKTLSRLTTQGNGDRPEWSPDGRRILFRSIRGDTTSLWWQPADGSDQGERLFLIDNGPHEGVLTPDGQTLVYRVSPPGVARRDIYAVSLTGDRKPRPMAATQFDEMQPQISRDGKWLAYISDESGNYEIYVRAMVENAGRTLVSAGGGTEPIWSRDGNRLFYRNGAKMMAATVVRTPGFSVTERKTLFEGNFSLSPPHANYDVAPDGKGFVMTAPTEQSSQVVVVQHWMSEQRARLGVQKR